MSDDSEAATRTRLAVEIARKTIARFGLKAAIPAMIGDAVSRCVTLERAHEAALAKIVLQGAQIADLQDRLAKVEAQQPAQRPTRARAKSIDPGNTTVVRLRDVASA